MQNLVLGLLVYLAAGATCFAHPTRPAQPSDFTPKGQLAVFSDTLPAVLTWPIALWHLLRAGRG
jgi:hypothetical protein